MIRFGLILLITLIIGVYVGKLLEWQPMPAEDNPTNEQQVSTTTSNTTGVFKTVSDQQRLLRLENELQQLKQRLQLLEEQATSLSEPETVESPDELTSSDEAEDAAEPLSKNNLVRAGVSEELASDILRRIGEQEYKRLQLRDLAIRDGSFRSGQYYKELRQLNLNNIDLRNEIGDEFYDRYLYQTGQNNRVAVSSIMSGSPAEQIGIQNGDVILKYNNQKIFDWKEIRQVTAKGELGEYVMVDILRDGEVINMMLPRGPMGVKLETTRINPDGQY